MFRNLRKIRLERKMTLKYVSEKLTIAESTLSKIETGQQGLLSDTAIQCLNAGIAEKVTTAWLGHHDSKVSKDVYQHIKSDFETEQTEKLAKYRRNKK